EILKFRDKGPSVEEAREAMRKAGEVPAGSAPGGHAVAIAPKPSTGFEEEIPGAAPVVAIPGITEEERLFVNKKLIERGIGQGTRVQLTVEQLAEVVGNRDLAARFIAGAQTLSGVVADALEPDIEEVVPPAPAAPPATPPAAVAPAPARTPEPERVETDK